MALEVKERSDSVGKIWIRSGTCPYCGKELLYWTSRHICYFCHSRVVWKGETQNEKK